MKFRIGGGEVFHHPIERNTGSPSHLHNIIAWAALGMKLYRTSAIGGEFK
jgi:hypothetical protein